MSKIPSQVFQHLFKRSYIFFPHSNYSNDSATMSDIQISKKIFILIQITIKSMRSNHRLRSTDFKSLQKNVKEKIDKEVEAITQLMELPDFDVSQFFQTLLKSEKYDEVLERISQEKKIDFFARNYEAFLQTQEQLLGLELPILQQIPIAKKFTFEMAKQVQRQENYDEVSVLDIIDSFSSFVLERNTPEVMRIYQIIMEMKKHNKYKKYFNHYSINKILLENYNSFIESCTDVDVLLKINETGMAIKVHLKEREEEIIQLIRTNLNVNDSSLAMGKEISKLTIFIEKELKSFRNKFKEQIQKDEETTVMLMEWIQHLTKQFYRLIQSFVYEKQELSEIFDTLSTLLDCSSETELKGISLQRQLKELISQDLPVHVSKVIDVIIESISTLLENGDELYEFVYLESIKKFSEDIQSLTLLDKQSYGKQCGTIKGIILVNSFILILISICDEKWVFLHQPVLAILIDRIALNIFSTSLHFWDYYHIFAFFHKLQAGKIKHKSLFEGQVSLGLKQKILKIKNLSEESWDYFENKVTNKFWSDVLSLIPGYLWKFRKYAESLQQSEIRPSVFSLEIIFKLEDFFKEFQFRLAKHEFERLSLLYFEYLIYVLEYILYWSFHSNGLNQKVFLLYKKQQKLLKKTKQFAIEDLRDVKQFKNILKISAFTKFGLQKFAFEMYYLTDIYKLITGVQKVECQQFLKRVSQVLGKEQKKDPINIERNQFEDQLKKMMKYYQERPEMLRKYVAEKKNNI